MIARTNTERARELRRNESDAEHRLWLLLRSRRLDRFKFRRQHAIGPYIVDFVCIAQGLVIELDGGQHAAQADYDARRTLYLEARHFRVVRFWNDVVLREPEAVVDVILAALSQPPHPSPLPTGERE